MSTVRVFQNNNRVATATYLKDGTILQVYPSKKNFTSEAEFRNYWRDLVLNTLEFKETPRPSSSSKKSKPVKKPAPAAAAKSKPEPAKISTEGWTFKKQGTFAAPAGAYYIGDLCYALPDALYDGVFGKVGGYATGLYQRNDDFFIMGGTAYGDGDYKGSDGKRFLVDAGIIGMAPIRICDMTKSSISGGHIYTFDKPVEFISSSGIFDIFLKDDFSKYRVLRIDTAGYGSEDEDEDEYYGGDEDKCDCCACEPR